MTDKITIYHHGSCPLCRAEIGHYRRQAGAENIAFVDVSEAIGDIEPGLTARRAMSRFHVRLPDGSLRSGAAAFAAVWATLPRWRMAARIATLPAVMAVLELGYRLSLLVRPILARGLAATTRSRH